ncbi:MAG: hypothetical protein SYC29_18700 [Planctomycetota bacterium]|nr:hypothetical protein [Planctomycetota bacterium]
MQDTHHSTGATLIDELESRDGMTPDEAKSWVEGKTGYRFDSQAMYKLRWPQHERSDTWSGYSDLTIHIMNDPELDRLEIKIRAKNKEPPRKPWEASMFEASMGRAEAAVRLDAGE